MIGLTITFDLGRAHATPWGTHVNEAAIEWPPSPWRIMRALLAASYTHAEVIPERDRLREAMHVLATAPAPEYVLPPSTPAHTRHYYPLASWSPTNSGKTSLVVDAFRAVEPDAELHVCWDTTLEEEKRQALELAATAVGYLGRSESVCTMRVTDHADGLVNAVPADRAPAWAADGRRVELWSVAPDRLAALETSVSDLRRARRHVPDGIVRVPYLLCEPPAVVPAVESPDVRPTVAHLRLRGGARPALTDTIDVARVLRAALQRHFDRVVGGGTSTVFSGHAQDGSVRRDQHRHAHYLVGSDPGAKRADHLWIWAPDGFGEDELAAIASLRELRFRNAPEPCRVGLAALGAGQLEIPQLLRPSRSWRSATPFVLPRHTKRRGGRVIDGPIEQIRRELAYRGLPEPEKVHLISGPWSMFRLTRPGESRRHARRAVGATLEFGQPVEGPIALGAHSHFGLGRFEPQA